MKLKEIYKLTIKINRRIYKQQLEQKGKSFILNANYKAKYNILVQRDNYYRLQKIKINTTKSKLGSNNKGLRKGQ